MYFVQDITVQYKLQKLQKGLCHSSVQFWALQPMICGSSQFNFYNPKSHTYLCDYTLQVWALQSVQHVTPCILRTLIHGPINAEAWRTFSAYASSQQSLVSMGHHIFISPTHLCGGQGDNIHTPPVRHTCEPGRHHNRLMETEALL